MLRAGGPHAVAETLEGACPWQTLVERAQGAPRRGRRLASTVHHARSMVVHFAKAWCLKKSPCRGLVAWEVFSNGPRQRMVERGARNSNGPRQAHSREYDGCRGAKAFDVFAVSTRGSCHEEEALDVFTVSTRVGSGEDRGLARGSVSRRRGGSGARPGAWMLLTEL